MSEPNDPVAAPRDREVALSAAYLRLLGHTQQEAANAAGLDPRTIGRWEASSWWPDIVREAGDRWLAGAIGKARRALLEALGQPDGPLALKVLERTVPELAPVSQRVELSGALMDVDLNLLSDHAISRIADGEHPVKVLISAVLGGEEDPEAVEHLREDILPRLLGAGNDDGED